MSRSNFDIVVRAPPGTPADITLQIPPPLLADISQDVVLNDPPGTPEDVVLRPANVGDGVGSHRNANLVGLRATTRFQNFPQSVALTGLRCTAINGYMQEYFLYDNFVDINNSSFGGHAIEPVPPASLGTTWNLLVGIGPLPIIHNNRLQEVDGSDQVFLNSNGVAISPYQDYYVEAQLYYAQIGPSFLCAIGIDTGTTDCYYFGWNDNVQQWEFGTNISGSLNALLTDTTNAFTQVVGEVRLLRIECMAGSGVNHLKCFVDGTEIFAYDDSVYVMTGGYVSIILGLVGLSESHSTDLEFIRAGPVTRILTGQVAVATAGTIVGTVSGGSSVSVTGQVATATAGTIIPEIGAKPLGRSATATAGTVTANTADVVVGLTGLAVTTAQGAFLVATTVGATGIQPYKPAIKYVGTGIVLGPMTSIHSSPMSVNGLLCNVSEYVFVDDSFHGYTPGEEGSRRFGQKVSQATTVPTQTEGWVPGGQYIPVSYRTPDQYGSPDGPQNQVSDGVNQLPNGEIYDFSMDGGGYYSIDTGGMIHWVHTRGRGRATGAMITGAPDVLYVYQNEASAEHSLPPAVIRRNIVRNHNREWLIGLYAHSSTNVYMLYPTPWSPATFALTGLRATATAGTITPAVVGAPNLVGNVATTRQGVLTTKVSDASRSVPLVGLVATTSAGSVGRADYAQMVPTYRHGDGYSFDSREIQIKDLDSSTDVIVNLPSQGAPEDVVMHAPFGDIHASSQSLTAIRSGYGWVYLCYVSATQAGFVQMGFVVIDPMTGNVLSHRLIPFSESPVWSFISAIGLTSSPMTCRPLAEVVKLSNGISVTQFMFAGHVVNVQWTSDTAATPSVVLKAGRSYLDQITLSGGFGSALALAATNWDSLEYKGDEVYHMVFMVADVSGVFTHTEHFQVYGFRNNAVSATDASWNFIGLLADYDNFNGTQVWEHSHLSGELVIALSVAGYGGGLPTCLWANNNNGINSTEAFDTFVNFGTASLSGEGVSGRPHPVWYYHWATQAPYLSVKTECQVGAVTTTIVNGTSAALTGLSCTTAIGTIVPEISTSNKTHDNFGNLIEGTALNSISGWGGQRINLGQGTIFFATPGFGAPVGQRATTVQGVIVPAIDKAYTGQSATTTAGLIKPEVAVTLVGQSTTATAGSLAASTSVNIALTGLQTVATAGAITTSLANVGSLGGQVGATAPGAIVPNIAVLLQGVAANASIGVLGVSSAVVLTGQQSVAVQGLINPLLEIPLTGGSTSALPGSVGISHSQTISVSGVQAVGMVGATPTNIPPIPSHNHLVTEPQVAPLFTKSEDDPLYNQVDP